MLLPVKLESGDIDTVRKRGKYTVSVAGFGRDSFLTACLLVKAGFRVFVAGSDTHVVNLFKKGRTPFVDPTLKGVLDEVMNNERFSVTCDLKTASSESEVIIINVPPSVDKNQNPNYSSLEKTCKEIGMGLQPGSLIIFQSTMSPGLTEILAKEVLEVVSGLRAGSNFGLAYSPSPLQHLPTCLSSSRIVGALDEQSLESAAWILGTITKDSIVRVRDLKTAETAKVFQGAHYAVNAAIANEFAHFCENAGLDFVEIRNALNLTPYPFPVPGISTGDVGDASCVLIDEADAINAKLRLLKLARKINDEMVAHTVHLVRNALRACQKTFRRAKIEVFGVSPSANRKDPISPQIKTLVDYLQKRGASVQVYDPFFSPSELIKLGYSAQATLTKTVEGTDCILITVGHDRFKRLNLKRINFFARKPAAIIDGGQVLDPVKVREMGFVYRGIGRGV